jgi:putative transposase
MQEIDHDPLQPNTVYHLISHAVENNNLFYNDGNYAHFLNKWLRFGHPYFKTYAFCLMPNHLHICVQTVDEATLKQIILDKKKHKKVRRKRKSDGTEKPEQPTDALDLLNEDISDEVLRLAFSRQMNTLLGSYAQSLNIERKRKGALFWGRFERLKVKDRDYFRDLICYIHHNPIHHFGVENYSEWLFSSYNLYHQPEEGLFLDKETVFKVFEPVGGFDAYHTYYQLNKRFWIIDEEVQMSFKKLKGEDVDDTESS